jgi:hypothetical protein
MHTRKDSFNYSVFLGVEELKDVGVPWLQVNSEGARSLVATLIYIPYKKINRVKHTAITEVMKIMNTANE